MKARVEGLLFDLDGTLYEGDRIIPGALDTLCFCASQKIPYRFVTNTTSKPRAEVAAKLRSLGISAEPEWIFTAPAAAREVFIQRGWTRAFLLLRPSLIADLEGITSVDESPHVVVVGDLGDDFSYTILNSAFRFLLDPSCAFVTLARNRYFKTSSGLNLDVGAFVAALEYSTNREAELVGKPAVAFFQAAVASMNVGMDRVLMVGDDVESDVLGAQAAGLQGVLVRTGKFSESALNSSKAKPDHVIPSIADLPGFLK